MKILLFISIVISMAVAEKNLTINECLKVKFGHTVGGTLHSKHILKKKLLKKLALSLPYTTDNAKDIIASQNPTLKITSIHLIIIDCKGYYKVSTPKNDYLFDATSLQAKR